MTGPFLSARVLRSAGPNRKLDAEWVIVGWHEHGKCRLLASTAVEHSYLSFSDVRQEWHFGSAEDLRQTGISMARHIEADLMAYQLIEADTFAEALAFLLFGAGWVGDSVRALGTAGMGRQSGPYVQEPQPADQDRWAMRDTPLPDVPCMHRPAGTQVMFCDRPRGHYPATPHAHTIEWDDDHPGPRPAIGSEHT